MAFTVNGPKWKQVRLEGQPGYWIQVDDNDSPIDLDEEGNIRVYSSKTDKNPQFGRIKQIGGIQREQDDKVAADKARRQADERAMNSGAWKFANVLDELPSFGMASQVTKGADEFRNGNYVKGTFEIASPMMFGTGALGTAARSVIGTYNLLNSEGIAKTIDLAKQGRYGRAALSGLGDTFNLAMSSEGWSPAAKFINKAMTLYNSPLTGKWTTIGSQQYRLSPAAGANRIAVERTPTSEIFEQERWNRFRNPKYVTDADKAELKSHFPEYKAIQERAMDKGNYMIIQENSPLTKMSTQLDDGRLLFTGDEGTWIQSQSQNFKARQNGTTTKVGFKGGTDQREIEGVTSNHAPETFPNQENGVFFAGPKLYADTYNHGQESPGFWLFLRNPYNMLNGGKKAFPLEDNTVRFARGVMSNPSYTGGELPPQTYNTINKAWNAEYLNNPEIVEFLSKDPNKMSPSELIKRNNLLRTIRQGQLSENEVKFNKGVESMIKSGKLQPLRSQYYDGFIGRDHALGWSPQRDFKWSFGSNPETYVIFRPEQAKLLVGNNGAFGTSAAYSRKYGGKLNRPIKTQYNKTLKRDNYEYME